MFWRTSLDGIIWPPPTHPPTLRSLWDFCRISSSAIAGKTRNFAITMPSLEVDVSLAITPVNHWCLSLIFWGVWGSFRVWLTLLTHFLIAPIISKPNHWKSTYLCQTSQAEPVLSVSSSSSLVETDDACTIAWKIPKIHLDINSSNLSSIRLHSLYIFKTPGPRK